MSLFVPISSLFFYISCNLSLTLFVPHFYTHCLLQIVSFSLFVLIYSLYSVSLLSIILSVFGVFPPAFGIPLSVCLYFSMSEVCLSLDLCLSSFSFSDRSNLLARHRFSKLDLSRKYDLNDRCKLSPVFTGTSDAALRSSLEGVKDAVSEHTVPGFLLWSPGVGGRPELFNLATFSY